MRKVLEKIAKSSVESLVLAALSFLFALILSGAWAYSTQLRTKLVANSAGMNIDPTPLIEIEKLRGLSEAQLADARSFFLLGSSALMQRQSLQKQQFLDSLASFEKRYNLPGFAEIKAKIEGFVKNQDEIFAQAMHFREQKTDSKIVGQFYQSKATAVRAKINDSLDEIVRLHQAELERVQASARAAGVEAEAMIPEGMKTLTYLLCATFFGMILLSVIMLFKRSRQIAERDRLYKEASKAVLDRDEVLSAISHDLKAPLVAIDTAANALIKPENTDETNQHIEIVKSSVQEIRCSIDDIRDLKNSDLKSLALRIEQIGIEELFDEAELILRPMARLRDVRLQFEPVNPPVSAFADRDRVLRILSNLISNAVKFSPRHSRVLIRARGDQQFINISVTDNGPGIPEKQLPLIFTQFFQAKATASQGAGVGLAVVKTLVEAQGGTVRAESLGRGTTFTFSLPRRRPVTVQVKKASTSVRVAARPAPIIEPQEAELT